MAAMTRLRPVMMTILSTVLGALPLILGSGPGAEARTAIGWVVFGGLGIATVFYPGADPGHLQPAGAIGAVARPCRYSPLPRALRGRIGDRMSPGVSPGAASAAE
jgi:hypothetical protein